MFEGICDILGHELDELEKKYANGGQLTAQDLEHIDRIAHAMKCLKTYEAMANSEYGERRNRYDRRDRDERYDYGRRY